MTQPGRVIVVGGAGGIGSSICRQLASSGYRLVIADCAEDRAHALAQALDGEGHEAIAFDVTDEAGIGAAFDTVEAVEPASMLVIASGGPVVHLGKGVNAATISMTEWRRTIDLNLTGTFACIQKFAQLRMAKPTEHGRIVVIGSAVGLGAGSGTDIAYISAKAALFGLIRQVAFELAPIGITANIVAPGPVATPEFMSNTNEHIRGAIASSTLVKRLALPEEVAASVAYLLSPQASFVTGASLDINGGSHMR